MKMDIGEVFCELVSGLAIMSLVLPFLDVWGVSSISKSLAFIGQHANAAGLAGALVLAYSLGLIMDAVGIPVSDWLSEKMEKGKTSGPERETSYIKASSHVLQHREYEYAYLVAYTNLLIIAIASVILWGWIGIKHEWSRASFLVFSFVLVCLVLALWKSIRFHLEQDAEITKAHTSADAETKLTEPGESG